MRWSNFRNILKIELIGFADGLGTRVSDREEIKKPSRPY